MLTTDATAEFRTYFTSILHGILDEFAHTILVEHLERVNLEDFLVEIYREEGCDVITALSECHLCEVVCTE